MHTTITIGNTKNKQKQAIQLHKQWSMIKPSVLNIIHREAFDKVCEVLNKVHHVMSMEYIVPSLWIAALTGMTHHEALKKRLTQLEELKEEPFLVGFHQQVQKKHEKSWHDYHIKLCTFKVNDLVLLYDSKFENFPGKFRMHWLWPYVVKEVTDRGMAQLVKLNGEPFPRKVNGNHLKPYMAGQAIWLSGRSTVFATWGDVQGHRTINICSGCQYICKDTIQTQRNKCSRFSKQQFNALQKSAPYGNIWRDSTPRSSCQKGDSRVSHDVYVGFLLGMESPHSMVWGSKHKFWVILL